MNVILYIKFPPLEQVLFRFIETTLLAQENGVLVVGVQVVAVDLQGLAKPVVGSVFLLRQLSGTQLPDQVCGLRRACG